MDYQLRIQTNPIVPFAQSGYQRSHWCNYIVLSNASIKSINVMVYANTAQQAQTYARQLGDYLVNNPVMNKSGIADDVTYGLRAPTLDRVSNAYVVSMVLNAGMLRMGGSPMQKKPTPTADTEVVNGGKSIVNNGKTILN